MSVLTAAEVLSLIPQQKPMRFVDSLLEIDDEHVLGGYTWTAEDCRGYSSDGTLVPPFKLIEMSAQIGSVAWCIYLMSRTSSAEEIRRLIGFFTEIRRGEFFESVHAGDRLLCQGSFDDDGYFRGNKLLSSVEIQFDGGPKDGRTVFAGQISGIWLPADSQK